MNVLFFIFAAFKPSKEDCGCIGVGIDAQRYPASVLFVFIAKI
jgi:hypothetical protein